MVKIRGSNESVITLIETKNVSIYDENISRSGFEEEEKAVLTAMAKQINKLVVQQRDSLREKKILQKTVSTAGVF